MPTRSQRQGFQASSGTGGESSSPLKPLPPRRGESREPVVREDELGKKMERMQQQLKQMQEQLEHKDRTIAASQGSRSPLISRAPTPTATETTVPNTLVESQASREFRNSRDDTRTDNGHARRELIGSICTNNKIQHFALLRKDPDQQEENRDWKDPDQQGENRDQQGKVVGRKMLRIAHEIWKLQRPKVLISVTGAASDITMSRNAKDKLLQGLMQCATETNAWFITGGTDTGIMKLIGEARTRSFAHSPLIGIATWNTLDKDYQDCITKHVSDEGGCFPGAQPLPRTPDKRSKVMKNPVMNPDHSHLFLIQGANDYGQEIGARGDFEEMARTHWQEAARSEAAAEPDTPDRDKWLAGWKEVDNAKEWLEDRGIDAPAADPADLLHRLDGKVPIVCVCVQGGPKTTDTVQKALKMNTPVLLVKGSGGRGASDLIADLHMLSRNKADLRKDSEDEKNETENKLLEFLARVAWEEEAQKNTKPGDGEHGSVGAWQPQGDAGKQSTEHVQPRELASNYFSTRRELVSNYLSTKEQVASLVQTLEKLKEMVLEAPDSTADPEIKRHRLRQEYHYVVESSKSRWEPPGVPSQEEPNTENELCAAFVQIVNEYWEAEGKTREAEGKTRDSEGKTRYYFGSSFDAFIMAVKIMPEKRIWRIDLRTAKDQDAVSNAVLRCLLRSVKYEEEGVTDNDQGERFYEKLLWSVEWNDLRVLSLVVNKTWLRRNHDSFLRPMSHALHRSLMLRRSHLADFLVNNGATVDWYKVDRHDLKKPTESVEELQREQRNKDKVSHAMIEPSYDEQWTDLILLLPESTVSVTQFGIQRRKFHDEVKKARKVVQHLEPRSSSAPAKNEEEASQAKRAKARADLRARSRELLVNYEKFVSDVAGAAFHYEMNELSPEFDLMVWSVLMNNRSLAYVWFKEYTYPIRSSLTVCGIYRNLSTWPSIPHSERKLMLESADFFETIAVELQLQARKMSYHHMLMTLEVPLPMWTEQTIVDVAVLCQCHVFVEKCCTEAIERRFAGDLLPFSQPAVLGLKLGLKRLVLANMLVFGLLAPLTMKFHTFPIAENLRFPTQRARVPEDVRRKYTRRVEEVYGVEVLKDAPAEEYESLAWEDVWPSIQRAWRHPCGAGAVAPTAQPQQGGAPTPSGASTAGRPKLAYWEAYHLYWQAPVTLFIAESVVLVSVVFSFSWFLFAAADATESLPFSGSHAASPAQEPGGMAWPVYPFEIILAVWFVSKAVSKFVEFKVAPRTADFVWNFWNWPDCGSVLCFFGGFGMRFFCRDHPGQCASRERIGEGSVEEGRLWVMLYSISIFLLYVRVLRIFTVHKVWGPLVVLILRMGKDILRFALIWLVLLLGFSSLLRGAVSSDLRKRCLAGEGPSEEVPEVACWRTWWIVRTFLQAFGAEIFLQDMGNSAAMLGLLLLWITMNVLMLNLLIAIMSNTYAKMQEESTRQHLMDLHRLVREYSRRSLAAPPPTNVLFLAADAFWYWRNRHKEWALNLGGSSLALPVKMDKHLRRNVKLEEMHLRAVAQTSDACCQCVASWALRVTMWRAGQKHRRLFTSDAASSNAQRQQIRKEDPAETKLHDTDLELEFCWTHKLDAFMERARQKFLRSPNLQDLLKQWDVDASTALDDQEGLKPQSGSQQAPQPARQQHGAQPRGGVFDQTVPSGITFPPSLTSLPPSLTRDPRARDSQQCGHIKVALAELNV